VAVVSDIEKSLGMTVTLDCSLDEICIEPICEQRILSVDSEHSFDFEGHCSVIHCYGIPMEGIIYNFVKC
jgi:hypothetical protein